MFDNKTVKIMASMPMEKTFFATVYFKTKFILLVDMMLMIKNSYLHVNIMIVLRTNGTTQSIYTPKVRLSIN